MMAFSALSDPTRLRIVEMLAAQGQLSASTIGSKFPVSAPAISQHLKVLKEANLVRAEVKAQQRIYRLNPDGMSEIGDWLDSMRRLWEERFDRLDALLKTEMKKSKPKKRKPHHDRKK